MIDIPTTTAEIKSLVFAMVSAAENSECVAPDELSLTLALLQHQINARLEEINEVYQTSSAEKAAPTRKQRLALVSDLPQETTAG
jgi:hypothetical protein